MMWYAAFSLQCCMGIFMIVEFVKDHHDSFNLYGGVANMALGAFMVIRRLVAESRKIS